ncbi:hypothetical protein BCR43DRAFT_486777 [Syncephalastrum racemosum]|uniref:Molybdate-anion transporter n=1 Tax=Syncephalastrum racemosum TaxID=13706 RepID=A0A1X2HPM5_SYNRA|nr:hypothetical protein BCR43DRAFT_486777 [Syncephalastrum racemosum]
MTMESLNMETGSAKQQASRFKALQWKYLSVYLTVMGADWLQGPYLYKLYQSYGLELGQIAFLFLTGFISGAFAGTAVGSLADSRGRRRVCLAYCSITAAALVLRLLNQYMLLFVSHLLSGLSTALLYSVFEAWYVAEHTSHLLPSDWLSRTFSAGTFLNGLVAIVAGVVANASVDIGGFKAPYTLAIALQGVAALLITSTWAENYGESSGMKDTRLIHTLKEGCQIMWKDSNILVLGTAQTVFECAMYTFVLLYTPAIENAAAIYMDDSEQTLPLGYLFSTMMFAVMIGSLTFQSFEPKLSKDKLLIIALTLASSAFGSIVYTGSVSLPTLAVAYHVFEFCTGMYYPAIASLKAEAIPEETRAAVMTLLRIPMNLGIGVIMWNVNNMSTTTMFAICSFMTFSGAVVVTARYKGRRSSRES